jgi:hypothetical protein
VHHGDLVESACDFFSRDQTSGSKCVACRPHLISKMLESDQIRLNIDYYQIMRHVLISGLSVAHYVSSQNTQVDQNHQVIFS